MFNIKYFYRGGYLKISNKLGNVIKQYRKKAGLTQPQLAELLHVSFSTLRRWETYGDYPRIDELQRLCDVLGCSEAELLNGAAMQDWELRLLVKRGDPTSKGVIDLTGKTVTSTLELSDLAMGITLSASYDLWEDDEKFEGLIEQLRKKRATGLKTRREDWE